MIKDDLIFTITIPNFITQIMVSKARRVVYYELNGKHKVPPSKLKHLNKKFIWMNHKVGSKTVNLFTEISTLLPIIKNSRVAGKPKFIQIKGNAFYSGFGNVHQRMLVINSIKNEFKKYFIVNDVKEFPIRLEWIIHNELNVVNKGGKFITQDGDNFFYPYTKSGQDLMTELGIIPDDNLHYIRKASWEFIESEAKDKRLIINAYKY